ncbi:MAG TPA: asparagine synthase (glutamine-hydrolyzing) [Opitutaceae bacterium]|jgi:asparagine synthase (glutamine-hydrolysing)
MCGIAGILSFKDAVDRSFLEKANAAQKHRGPDDSGLYVDGRLRAGLSMRRLAIIDLSAGGHQPMVWSEPAGDVVIAYNGETYNFHELKAECDAAAPNLLGGAIPWRGTSDTEVLLWSYLLWGADMLPLLDGMFAFAIWDGRSGRMLLARDRFGVKPLYYALEGKQLSFASEIKGLVELGLADRSIDPMAIGQYVAYLYTPGCRTMFRSVRKLGPGEAMIAGPGGLEKIWTFANGMSFGAIDRAITEDQAARKLRELLGASVERQMVSDVPVGAFLSGGLDSSSIVSFARHHTKDRLQCFTIGRKDVFAEEEGYVADLPYAERVAAHLGVDLQTIWVGPEMAERFSWMVAQLDEPQADPAALNAYFIAKLAHEQGIKVLLSGAGGDDIFTGYRRHNALMKEPFWSWLPKNARRALRITGEALPKGTPLARRAAKALQYADWPEADRLISYFLWLNLRTLQSLFTPEFLESVGHDQVLAPMREAISELPEDVPPLNQMLYLDSRFFLADHNLNYTDKMSMAASMEVRVPYLDPDLVKFSTSLPLNFKQRGRVGKWIFKRAMEPVLPHDVIYREKTGFGVPLRHWLKHELKEQVDDTLSDAVLRRRGIFNPAGVRRLIELDREGRMDASYPIFALMCIETWCRRFVDQSPFPN